MNSISDKQLPLIEHLFQAAGITVDISILKIEAMKDGGMGSQKFSSASQDSIFGGNVAEIVFEDLDGVEVNAALFIDQYGKPYELDMFKGDNSELKKWPLKSELRKDN